MSNVHKPMFIGLFVLSSYNSNIYMYILVIKLVIIIMYIYIYRCLIMAMDLVLGFWSSVKKGS